MFRRIYRIIRSTLLHYLIPQSRVRIFENGQAIEVVGLFYNASGLGESARLCAQQLKDEGFKVRCTSIEDFLFKQKEIPWEFVNTAREDEIGCRIIHLNPPMIPPYALRTGLQKFSSIYNIGYWAWELEKLPAEWIKSMRYINAIISPSNFTTATMRRHTDKPVMTVPHPVKIASAASNIREKIGLKPTDFLVSCVFSLQSSLERKNPKALIEAFLKAFGNSSNVYLVFKISKIGKGKEALSELARSHKNIFFIDDVWSRGDILGLIQTSNVYASLHRAEGFGLALAEAMLLGTPVMATNWSGNVDFCNDRNSFPVNYTMTSVKSRHTEFSKVKNAVWAEADEEQAAAILKSIYSNPTEALAKAKICMAETNQYFTMPYYSQVFQNMENSNEHYLPVDGIRQPM